MQAQRKGLDREVIIIGGVVVIGMIMAILDATIVNVAIPTLGAEFHTSISTIQWVMTAYLLALASTIPVSGWAGARFGTKPVWIASLALFTLGSCLAGAAPSIDWLIASRVVQGAAAGLIMPVGQTILLHAAGPGRIGRVMSVIGIPMLLAPIAGPVIGGAIVEETTWRWIFFVNLPVAAIALTLAWRLLPDAAPQRGQRLDLRGLALLSPGIAIAVYGLRDRQRRNRRHAGSGLDGGRGRAGRGIRRARVAFQGPPADRRLAVRAAWLRGGCSDELPARHRAVRLAHPAAALLPARPGR